MWCIPSGRLAYDRDPQADVATELGSAQAAFFQPGRFRDRFGSDSLVGYDSHKLLLVNAEDPVGNAVSAQLDYRVLQPLLVTDPNRNRRKSPSTPSAWASVPP